MTVRPAPDVTVLRARDLVRGLGALATLVVLVVGVPALLETVAPIGLPDALPPWDDVVGYATRPDDGTILIGALSLIAWIGWAAFTLSALVETGARLRGVRSVRLPLLSRPQRVAAALVAAISLALPTAGTAAVRLAAQPAIVATAPLTASVAEVSGASSTVHAGEADEHATVVVQRHDTLWGLAARHLGEGRRYRDIAALNYGRPQPDGTTLTHDHWLNPGWVLRLPAGTPTPATAGEQVVVLPGDTLWSIAEAHLGDAHRYVELFALNQGKPQPDGGRLHDPDLIRSGWRLDLPARPPVAAPPAATSPAPVTPAPVPVTPAPVAPLPATPSPPATSLTPTPSFSPTPPQQPSQAPSTAPAPRPTPRSSLDADAAAAVLVLGLTGLASSALLHEVRTRRRRQQSRRRPGGTVPLPAPEPASLERRLRAMHDPHAIERVQTALQALAAACPDAQEDLPPLAAILLAPDNVDLVMTTDSTPLRGFIAVDPRTWRFRPETEPTTTFTEASPPYPLLVTLGVTGDAIVLLNLEAVGTLTLVGSPDDVTAVERALALELVASPLTRGSRIGLGPELTDLVDVSRAERDITHPGAKAFDIRVRLTAEDHVEPWTGRALITATPSAATSDRGWTLDATLGRVAHLDPLGLSLACQHLEPEVYQHALDLLDTASRDPEPASTPTPPTVERPARGPAVVPLVSGPASAAVAVPLSPEPEDPDSADGAVRVLLLGPVSIVGADDDAVPNRRRRLTELVAYLALHPGATYHQIDEALWPGRRVPTDTRNATVSRARRWLGTTPDGEPYLQLVTADGDYRLDASTSCDWHDFQRLARQGLGRPDDVDLLASALRLVRGRPFLGVDPRDYAWSEADTQEMIYSIVDAAHTLAHRLAETGDHRGAQDAASKGLLAEPCSELLHRDVIRAALARGDRAEAARLAARLRSQIQRLDADAEFDPETEELLASHDL